MITHSATSSTDPYCRDLHMTNSRQIPGREDTTTLALRWWRALTPTQQHDIHEASEKSYFPYYAFCMSTKLIRDEYLKRQA